MVCIQLLSFSVYLPLKYYSPTVLQKCWYAGPGQDFNLQNWTVNSSQAVMTMWLEQLSSYFVSGSLSAKSVELFLDKILNLI